MLQGGPANPGHLRRSRRGQGKARMSRSFEELDFRPTPMGVLTLRRRRRPMSDVDVYEITQRQWVIGSPLPSPRHHAAAAGLDGWVYVSGGASSAFTWTPHREVWRARHRMLTRDAAIKLIQPDMLSRGKNATLLQRRFEQEAKATASLRSPNTIELYDFGVSEDGVFYYVMELLDGIDLETLVRRFGPQPAPRLLPAGAPGAGKPRARPPRRGCATGAICRLPAPRPARPGRRRRHSTLPGPGR